ncbi:hypothetical protein C0Z18_17780 [Trinickia dabaoshanensis]|uniref:Uncharacterized protein n=1 Tax=Trinickia dabaoshanensis TaxID=564714 RepID=A0A2N7VLQ9_9BURK|nr:hypothetical protein [Trinickia dabaoshanensis]PMS18088.1 hypothetical protein C0Z18_17780 [Trinickia dabaoshanensis]
MRHIEWVDKARHWVDSTLHWTAVKAAVHNAIEQEREPEWVIAYGTADGFCCLHQGEALEFADIEDVRAWASDVDVSVYFIGL